MYIIKKLALKKICRLDYHKRCRLRCLDSSRLLGRLRVGSKPLNQFLVSSLRIDDIPPLGNVAKDVCRRERRNRTLLRVGT